MSVQQLYDDSGECSGRNSLELGWSKVPTATMARLCWWLYHSGADLARLWSNPLFPSRLSLLSLISRLQVQTPATDILLPDFSNKIIVKQFFLLLSLHLLYYCFCSRLCSVNTFSIVDQTNFDEAHQASNGHCMSSCRNHGNPLQS